MHIYYRKIERKDTSLGATNGESFIIASDKGVLDLQLDGRNNKKN
jgi:hypothetical protein